MPKERTLTISCRASIVCVVVTETAAVPPALAPALAPTRPIDVLSLPPDPPRHAAPAAQRTTTRARTPLAARPAALTNVAHRLHEMPAAAGCKASALLKAAAPFPFCFGLLFAMGADWPPRDPRLPGPAASHAPASSPWSGAAPETNY